MQRWGIKYRNTIAMIASGLSATFGLRHDIEYHSVCWAPRYAPLPLGSIVRRPTMSCRFLASLFALALLAFASNAFAAPPPTELKRAMWNHNRAVARSDPVAARQSLEEAIEIAERSKFPIRFRTNLRVILARYLESLGDHQAVWKTYRESVQAFTHDRPIDGSALQALVSRYLDFAMKADALPRAEQELEQMLAMFHSNDDAQSAVGHLFFSVLSHHYRLHSESESSIRTGFRALAYSRSAYGDMSERTGIAFNEIGYSYIQAGNCTDSQLYLRYALAIYLDLALQQDVSANIGSTGQNLSNALACLGNWESARRLIDVVVELRQRALGPEHPQLAQSLVTKAQYTAQMMDRSSVSDLYARAISIYTRHGLRHEIAKTRVDRAIWLSSDGLLDEGLAELKETCQLSEEIGPAADTTLVVCRFATAVILEKMGKLELAFAASSSAVAALPELPAEQGASIDPSLQIGRSVDNLRVLAESQLASLADKTGRDALALQMSTRVIGLQQWHLLAKSGVQRLLGMNFQDNSDTLFRSKPLVDMFLPIAAKNLNENGIAELSLAAFQMASGTITSSNAYQAIERKKRQNEQDRRRQRRLHDLSIELRSLDKRLIEIELENLVAFRGSVRKTNPELVESFNLVLGEIQGLQGEPLLGGMAQLNVPVASRSVIGSLKPDEAAVAFYCTDQESYAWILVSGAEQPVLQKLDPNCAAVAVLKDRLKRGLGFLGNRGAQVVDEEGTSADVHTEFLRAGLESYNALLRPVIGKMEGKSTLLIIPSREFTDFPWQLLIDTVPDETLSEVDAYRKASWLIRHKALAIVPSLSLLAERNSFKRMSRSKKYLGIANPFFGQVDERSGESPNNERNASLWMSLVPLPETLIEIDKTASILGRTQSNLLSGPLATEDALKELSDSGQLRDYRIIHFATHGLTSVESDGKLEPALVLTRPAKASIHDDGFLAKSEIMALDFDADWVVLSACDTAAGESRDAEPLSGLANAFMYSGANAVLVSYWPVYSDAAVDLTTNIFASGHDNGAQALRRSMLAMIDGKDSSNSHPVRWAPFMFVGVPE